MSYKRFIPENVGVCLSTLMPDPRRVATGELERMLAACSNSGFQNLSVSPPFVNAVGVDTLKKLSDQQGMSIRTIEGMIGWTNGPEPAAEDAKNCLALSSALGADMLLAATIAREIDVDSALNGLKTACELAAASNVRVALEFIPGTAVPDLATAWELVLESGFSNAGVVLDMLHWYHQPEGPDFDLLRSIPAERIFYVQVCDSPAVVTPQGEAYIPFAMTARELPGKGVVDITALLTALDEMGVDPYFAAETFNTGLALSGVEAMTERLRESIAAMLG